MEQWIALGPFVWGRGKSPADALASVPHGHEEAKKFRFFKLPEKAKAHTARVTNDGTILWEWVDDATAEEKAEKGRYFKATELGDADVSFAQEVAGRADEALNTAINLLIASSKLDPASEQIVLKLESRLEDIRSNILNKFAL